jgi:hypothetical protein
MFEQVPQLSADIQIPEFCYSGEEEEIDINVWIGTSTSPSIHHFIIQGASGIVARFVTQI